MELPGYIHEDYPDTYPRGARVHIRRVPEYTPDGYPNTYQSLTQTTRFGTRVPHKQHIPSSKRTLVLLILVPIQSVSVLPLLCIRTVKSYTVESAPRTPPPPCATARPNTPTHTEVDRDRHSFRNCDPKPGKSSSRDPPPPYACLGTP